MLRDLPGCEHRQVSSIILPRMQKSSRNIHALVTDTLPDCHLDERPHKDQHIKSE